jgi:hypothetical protein
MGGALVVLGCFLVFSKQLYQIFFLKDKDIIKFCQFTVNGDK